MKHQSYLTRALKARDRRFARILGKLGYNTTDMAAEGVEVIDIDKLRATYQEVFGKRPFNGWDTATLLAKLEAKRADA